MCKERNKPDIIKIIPKLNQDYTKKNIKKIDKKHALYIYLTIHVWYFLELTKDQIRCIKYYLKPARENPNFIDIKPYVKLLI